MRRGYGLIWGLAMMPAGVAAQDTTARPPTVPTVGEADTPSPSAPATGDVVVTGRLDAARDRIAPALGAVTYTLGPAQIAVTPQGENAAFNQVLLRAPGVVLDSFGEEHVRGEHGGLTYRINGVLLPEGLNGFGQEIDTRVIQSVSLITGSLPAQFGFRTAGIVDVTAKSGAELSGLQASIYGGSYDWVQPSVQLGGSGDAGSYYVSGSFLHDAIGIENPVDTRTPLHDDTNQGKLFVYASHDLDADSRISVLASGSIATFQLPDTPNLPALYTLAGTGPVASTAVDERQRETNAYLVLSYQRQAGAIDLQVSPYLRYGIIRFRSDPPRDLVFQGVAADVDESFLTAGIQADAAWKVAPTHTVRFGLLVQHTGEHRVANSLVFPVDANGNQTSTTPLAIDDDARNGDWEVGAYLQDEWRLTGKLILNYGLRYDRFEANFDSEGQVSPRANLVWTPDARTTLHLGYARYFAPPTAQYLSLASLLKFAGTTEAPTVFVSTPTRVERSNYFDAGVQRVILPGWQVTVDGFFKDARNLGDLGQFGAAVILSPFSYARGRVWGSELSSTWTRGPWSAFGNFSYVGTSATTINSAEYEFPPDELAYIATHHILLDHEGQYTVSGGSAWAAHGNRAYLDVQYGYGLRAGFANLDKEPSYATINTGGEHRFGGKGPTLRVDVLNLLDHHYQIRDGSGLGISAAQWGRRRSVFVGLAQKF